ncbi:hypothetical protein MMC28_011239 [Mycoblastus sanguinarius]|nr:hypothetical protein [Mycoblastus sanguinarius]
MKFSTTIVAGLSVLYSVFCPVAAVPTPVIHVEGRQFNSRFAPEARPVFPRSFYDNSTQVAPRSPTAAKREYPAGPTASALVFRSEAFDYAPKN